MVFLIFNVQLATYWLNNTERCLFYTVIHIHFFAINCFIRQYLFKVSLWRHSIFNLLIIKVQWSGYISRCGQYLFSNGKLTLGFPVPDFVNSRHFASIQT